jgi:CBS domain containing-hemolysin-like protein
MVDGIVKAQNVITIDNRTKRIQATLGVIPSPGAEIKVKGYTFRVLKMDGTRMEKVMMILPPGETTPTGSFKAIAK